MVYQIRIKGHLGCEWTDWFGGLTITLEDNGETLSNRPGDRSGRVVWPAQKSAQFGHDIDLGLFNRTRPGGNSRDRAVKSTRITHKRS